MKVKVDIFPPFCILDKKQEIIIELEESIISSDMLIDSLIQKHLLKDTSFNPKFDWHTQMVVFRNNSILSKDDIINDNDVIRIFSQLEGG